MREVELIEHSPVANVRRPKVSEDSPTVGLAAAELDRLLTAAEADGTTSAALVSLRVYNGLRIDEALRCDIEDFTYQRGHRVLRITRKGGRASTEPLSPIVSRAIEDAVAGRTAGPVFLNRDGTARLSYSTSYALIRRLAHNAGIAAAGRLSPHSLRHSFATELLGAGVPLQDVQDAMGHADPRTTRRYDRSRHNLDRHPTYRGVSSNRTTSTVRAFSFLNKSWVSAPSPGLTSGYVSRRRLARKGLGARRLSGCPSHRRLVGRAWRRQTGGAGSYWMPRRTSSTLVLPASRSTRCRAMSVPAEMPADVMMSPSSTNRSCRRTSMVESSSASLSKERQCVVAGRPFNRPAAA
jgi:hypothetical protein